MIEEYNELQVVDEYLRVWKKDDLDLLLFDLYKHRRNRVI